jgi:hypothetical protein
MRAVPSSDPRHCTQVELATVPIEQQRRRPGRLAAWLIFVLALTVLAYAGRLGDSEPPEDIA